MSEYEIVTIPISQCYLRNIKLENNPKTQKDSDFYQSVLKSIKENGMVNPLTGVKKGNRYEIALGNNRYLAAKELGIESVKVVVVPNDEVKTLRDSYSHYEDVDNFFIPRPKNKI